MSTGDFPSAIKGFRFLRRRELPPVSTCWDFAVTDDFSMESATELLTKLPEDFDLSYFDPDFKEEESWIFIRRAGKRYFRSSEQHGVSSKYHQISLNAVRTLFMRCPLVQRLPPERVPSFTIRRIPDHQRDWPLHVVRGLTER
jgi:hypothetical protein